jgi:tyrosyl-tRNA synthetase
MTLSEELTWRGLVNQTTFKDIKDLDKEKRVFYFGVDANSAPSATVGNLAAMMMVKRFIKHGNTPILLVGGATGRIGDPKDDEERPEVTDDIVESNKKGIVGQYKDVFDGLDFLVVDNNDWFKSINYINFLKEVGKRISMSQLLDRDFVKSRVGDGKSGLSYAEFSYSLIQGYDFLHLFRNHNTTLQICGSDQWGNSIQGVDLIRKCEAEIAHVWSCPLIINKSTGKKFGKSEEGAIWLSSDLTSVFKFYQFWLNMDDGGVGDYLKIYTEIMPDEFDKLMADFKKDPAKRIAQKFLAYEVTKIVHGEEAANRAKKMTEVLFDGRNVAELNDTEFKELAEELPNSKNDDLLEFLVETKLAESKSAARRLVEQGSIQINGAKADLNTKFSTESLVKKGKNSFAVKL